MSRGPPYPGDPDGVGARPEPVDPEPVDDGPNQASPQGRTPAFCEFVWLVT